MLSKVETARRAMAGHRRVHFSAYLQTSISQGVWFGWRSWCSQTNIYKKTLAKITISNGQYITIFNDLTKLNNGILKIIKGVKIDDASPEHPEERSTF